MCQPQRRRKRRRLTLLACLPLVAVLATVEDGATRASRATQDEQRIADGATPLTAAAGITEAPGTHSTDSGTNANTNGYNCQLARAQGLRRHQEDHVLCFKDLLGKREFTPPTVRVAPVPVTHNTFATCAPALHLLAVLDGHNGAAAVEMAAEELAGTSEEFTRHSKVLACDKLIFTIL